MTSTVVPLPPVISPHTAHAHTPIIFNLQSENMKSDLIERLLKRAEIRRQIKTRKSVQNGEPDRISDLLEEAAEALALFGLDKHVYDAWLEKTKRDPVCRCALSCIGGCKREKGCS